jgi:fumarate hydratase class II
VRGQHDGDFPLDVYQTGSGTSTNMNTNEVIATLASRDRRANPPERPRQRLAEQQRRLPDRGPPRRDRGHRERAIPAIAHLAESLERKADEFAHIVKAGRTHLMDATPVTLGQEFGGYAAQVRYAAERLEAVLPRVGELPLGGTAVGTGINTPAGFAGKVIGLLVDETGLPLREARNHFEAQGARDGLVEASGALKTVAVSLYKICNDLRWMGSGPRAGLGEILIPDLQPGSSIMPGKVNPVICEATMMACAQVIGNDLAVTFSGSAGNFELNVMMPVMARNVIESIRLLTSVSRLLADRCVDGIQARESHMRHFGRVVAQHRDAAQQVHRVRERRGRGQEGAQGRADHPRRGHRRGLPRLRAPHRGAAGRCARRQGHDPATPIGLRVVRTAAAVAAAVVVLAACSAAPDVSGRTGSGSGDVERDDERGDGGGDLERAERLPR